MPASRISEPTPGRTLAWLVQEPEQAARAVGRLSSIANMQLAVVAVQDATRQKQTLITDDRLAMLPLPIGFPTPYAQPTGRVSRAAFNANESTTVSSPPTQAEVQAIQDRLTETRRIIAAIITDLTAARYINQP